MAVQWEGPCTLAKLFLEVLASETSIFTFILKCWNVQHDCFVLQKLKFLRASKVSLASLMEETFWLQSELPRGVEVLTAPVSPLIRSVHFLHSGNKFKQGQRVKVASVKCP